MRGYRLNLPCSDSTSALSTVVRNRFSLRSPPSGRSFIFCQKLTLHWQEENVMPLVKFLRYFSLKI